MCYKHTDTYTLSELPKNLSLFNQKVYFLSDAKKKVELGLINLLVMQVYLWLLKDSSYFTFFRDLSSLFFYPWLLSENISVY